MSEEMRLRHKGIRSQKNGAGGGGERIANAHSSPILCRTLMSAYRKQQSSFAKGDTVKSTESVRDLLSDRIEHVNR